MPARFPFSRRAPAAAPVPGRGPASLPSPSPQVAPPRPASRWTVAPGDADDRRLHRRQPSPAAGRGALKRPAVRTASLDVSPVTAPAPAAGRGRGDFSGVPAHRTGASADPRQLPAAAHLERALLSPHDRLPTAALEGQPRRHAT